VSDRADRLAQLVSAAEIDALLVTGLVNVEYLTGFTGSNGACLVGPEQRVFLTDFRYAEVAAGLDGWDARIVSGDWLAGLGEHLAGRVGIEDDKVTVRTAHRLGEVIDDRSELVDSGGLVEGLRRVKDPDEIAAITAAAELTDRIYAEIFERGLVGRTEADVSAHVVARMREEGAEPSFPPIVAAGPNGALPHAEPGPRVIGSGELVVIDMGSRLDGYCSDCTRTVATGRLDAEAGEIYEVTLRANELALGAVSAGASTAMIDKLARDLIDEAGYGEYFGHGLGHGVGMEIHEAPRLGPRSDEALVVGDVVTVEPGIYLADRYGVRIEDLVVVGESGVSRNLSAHPKVLTHVD
jgi:Xaa-Pro aminopeptidase